MGPSAFLLLTSWKFCGTVYCLKPGFTVRLPRFKSLNGLNNDSSREELPGNTAGANLLSSHHTITVLVLQGSADH
jgi:hypothetical protein